MEGFFIYEVNNPSIFFACDLEGVKGFNKYFLKTYSKITWMS